MLPYVTQSLPTSASQFSRSIASGYADSRTRIPVLEVPHKTIRKITCLGSGFVGGELSSHHFTNCRIFRLIIFRIGPTSAVTAFKSNVEVTVVDINSSRIAAWKTNCLPIYEPGLHDIVRAARDGIQPEDHSSPITAGDVTPESSDCFAKMSYAKGFLQKPNLFFSTDIDSAIRTADLIFVCVNTPTKANGIGKGAAADLGFVEAATRNIAKVALESKIVVEKSTVPCRTAQSIREIVGLQHQSNF